MDETFWSALEKWYMTKTWGLANGNIGWANEPMEYIEAITLLESEKNAVEVEEMKARQQEMEKNKGKRKGAK